MAVILVVDDDPRLAECIGMQVESRGHQALLCFHGGEAFELLKRRPVDVVVTDIFMPEIEGFEFIQCARRNLIEVPIVAMTGGSQRQYFGVSYDFLDIARKLGATHTLNKPFTRRQLMEKIEACLGDSRVENVAC